MCVKDNEAKLLSKEGIALQLCPEGVHVLASLFEQPLGTRWWQKFRLIDLPNELISTDDMKRFGINLADNQTRGSKIIA